MTVNSEPKKWEDSKFAPQELVIEEGTTKRYQGNGNAFADGGATELYEPIPEYEGRHRYDPTADWTEKEEKKLVRRVC